MKSPQNSLIRLLELYGLTLPKNAIEWRVCSNENSSFRLPHSHSTYGIPGHHVLHESVTLLLTDGVVCWFLLGDKETLFFGHLSNFKPMKDELEKKPRVKDFSSKYEDID